MSSSVLAKHAVYQYRTPAGSPMLINGVALNAAEANRTLILPVASPFIPYQAPQLCYDQICVFINIPSSTGGSVFTAVLQASLDGGVNYGRVQQQVVDTITNDLTISDFFVNKSITGGSTQFVFHYPLRGYTHLKIIFSSTAPTDIFSAQATASAT